MCAIVVPSIAVADGGPRRLNDPGIDMWSTGSRQLVYQALALPAVQAAVRDFEAQGYIRVPTYDGARSIADTSLVLIAFQQPGVDMNLSMPVIAVVTTPGSLGPSIDVRGGILERAPSGGLRAGTSFGAHTLHVTGGGDLSTSGSAIRIDSDPTTDQMWLAWINCTFWYCVECSGLAMPVLAQMLCCYVMALWCHKTYVY
jgi:hypothetical protein